MSMLPNTSVRNFYYLDTSVPITGNNFTTFTITQNGTFSAASEYRGFNELNISVHYPEYIIYSNNYISSTITTYTDYSAAIVLESAFAYCHNLSSVVMPNCSYIGSYAFQECSQLSTLDFPNCEFIGASAFLPWSSEWAPLYYEKFTSANFPKCKVVGSNAFEYCYYLTDISFPECSHVCSEAFRGCSSLTVISMPKCKVVDFRAFNDCYNVASINMPALEYIRSYGLAGNYCKSASLPAVKYIEPEGLVGLWSITSIFLPECLSVGGRAFQYCYSLTSVSLPKCESFGGYYAFGCDTLLSSISLPKCKNLGYCTFTCPSIPTAYSKYYCSYLSQVDLGECTFIGEGVFSNCWRLTGLNMPQYIVPVLENSNAFYSTPIAGYSSVAGMYGSIFVPAPMLLSFTLATNWSYFASRIVGV